MPPAAGTQPPPLFSLPTAAILCAVLFWGSSFPAMKYALQTFDPWGIMLLRLGLGSILLSPFLHRLLPTHVIRTHWRLFLPLVALQPCLYFLLESYALQYTTAAQASIVAASLPITVAVGAHFCLKETLSPFGWGGLFLSVLGVAGLTLASTPSDQAPNPLLGNILELGAMFCAASSIVLIKHLSSRVGPWSITAIQTLGGGLFFLPGAYTLLQVPYADFLSLLPLLLYLGAFVTLGAFGLYNIGIAHIPASRAAVFINLIPVAAVSFACLFLGETLTTRQILFAGCVLLGVWVTQRSH